MIFRIGKKKKENTEKKTMRAAKDTLIGELLDYDIDLAQFFFAIGMHCLGCPASRGETIEEACAVHGTDADELIKSINEFLDKKEQESK